MMRPLSLQELAQPLEAQLFGAAVTLQGVAIDSRKVSPGDLFVALPGERVDGHDFIERARAAGAAAALVARRVASDLPQLLVQDTVRALGQLGRYNRALFDGTLVALTGSSGKTTVRAMIESVLSRVGNTHATTGNFNNEIGLPLTLIALAPEHRFAVIEMGAAGYGHIDYLCQLAQPRVSLLLNAMPAHLEGFGSVADVARAKAEIFDHLGTEGTAVINADQEWTGEWRERAAATGARVITFGLSEGADVSVRDVEVRGLAGSEFTLVTPVGNFAASLRVPGRHNVINAAASAAVAIACGVDPQEIALGLAETQPVSGRGVQHRTAAGPVVIDDCYNANPGSVRAAIDTLAACAGDSMLLLGEMYELGPESAKLHAQMGDYAKAQGLSAFIGVGDALRTAVDRFGEGGQWFPNNEAVVAQAPQLLAAADTLLVKGSRSSQMEVVLQALLAAGETGAAENGGGQSACS